MTGIGNDIIALKTIDNTRTRDPRFYSKILSPAEQSYLSQFTAIPLEQLVWLLWSVKESVYKCLQRHQPALVFSPVKTEVNRLTAPSQPHSYYFSSGELEATGFNNAECFCSEIHFENQIFYARSIIYAHKFIVTVALPENDFSQASWGIKQIENSEPDYQSSAARGFLLKRISVMIPHRQLNIEKNKAGCPLLFADGAEANVLITLSHHDRYVGYAFTA